MTSPANALKVYEGCRVRVHDPTDAKRNRTLGVAAKFDGALWSVICGNGPANLVLKPTQELEVLTNAFQTGPLADTPFQSFDEQALSAVKMVLYGEAKKAEQEGRYEAALDYGGN